MTVSPVFRDRWLSGQHVGAARPTVLVRVQPGLLDRAYRPFDGNDGDFGMIANSKHNAEPWHAFWRVTGDWRTLPNVQHVEVGDEFNEQTGMGDPATCTIVLDNIIYQEIQGVGGAFRQFVRGYLSPWRGWTNLGQREAQPGIDRNEWFDILNGGVRVRVWMGYGDALEPVFTGVIDDTDVDVNPDTITLSCRSFGVALTEHRVFGWNKAKELRSPIVFADRQKAEKIERTGGAATASTTDVAHPAASILKPDDSFWLSHGHTIQNFTEWVQIRLPRGHYETFFVNPGYDGLEMYVSVFIRNKGLNGKAKVNGEPVDNGWVDVGLGDVPGANGGIPYTKRWSRVNEGGVSRKLGITLDCGDDTVLRVSFRNLQRSPGKGDYRAKCKRLYGQRKTLTKAAKKHNWILVDDATDVVKWALMWAGFKNWRVDPLGVRLKNQLTFHQSNFLSDIVGHIAGLADYQFFIDSFNPDDEADIGTPHFVRTGAIRAPVTGMEEVRDTDLLSEITTKFSKEPLAWIIRVRGKAASKAQGGRTLGEDTTRRVAATYFPPWSGAHHDVVTGKYSEHYPFQGRMAGIWRHAIHMDNNVESPDEAMMMCLLIAIKQALAALRATIEIPGHPGLRLNEQVSIVDTASGANTRLWVTSNATSWTGGEDAEFRTTLGGAMVDSPDLFAIALDYLYFLSKVQQENE